MILSFLLKFSDLLHYIFQMDNMFLGDLIWPLRIFIYRSFWNIKLYKSTNFGNNIELFTIKYSTENILLRDRAKIILEKIGNVCRWNGLRHLF